jgi:microcin C transport system substrate-binding protein
MKKILFSIFALITFAIAKPEFAISRFGHPKHKETEKSMPYLNPEAPKGGRLRMATLGNFDSLNRFVVKGFPSEGLLLCYDTLLKPAADDPYSKYALVAEKVEVAPDKSEMTFYLNPKAKFHDGHPITTEDIKFSIEVLRDKGYPRYKKYYSAIKEIKIIDPHTIKLVFSPDKQGDYDKELPLVMGNLALLPKHALEGKDFASLTLQEIPGSGPYKLKSYSLGRKIVFERVPDYWAKDLPLMKGAYNFDEISIDYFKSEHALRESLKAGEIDFYMEPDQKSWHTAYDFPAVRDGRVIKLEVEHKGPVAARAILFNLKNPIFSDRKVRQAIAMAFNFQQINQTQYHGAFKPMTSLFANTKFVPTGKPTEAELKLLRPFKDQLDPEIFEQAITPPQGDRRQILTEADRLLKEAGWVIEKGVRVHEKTKKPLAFTFIVKDPRIEGLALEFQRCLKPLGIKMTVAKIDMTQYEKQTMEKTFDVIFHTWANTKSPGIEQTYYFDPKMADQVGSSNYGGVKNEAIFALAKKVANATDEDELIIATKAFDRAVMGMYYMVPGVYDNVACFSYWKDRLDYPTINPEIGTNVPEWWWATS